MSQQRSPSPHKFTLFLLSLLPVFSIGHFGLLGFGGNRCGCAAPPPCPVALPPLPCPPPPCPPCPPTFCPPPIICPLPPPPCPLPPPPPPPCPMPVPCTCPAMSSPFALAGGYGYGGGGAGFGGGAYLGGPQQTADGYGLGGGYPSNDCCCQCGSPCRYMGRARTHGARIFAAPTTQDAEDPTCNSDKLRTVIEENIAEGDPSASKREIRRAAEERLFSKINVICANGDFSYVAYTNTYCQATSGNVTCYAFRPLGLEPAAGSQMLTTTVSSPAVK